MSEEQVRYFVISRLTWRANPLRGSVVVLANCGHRCWLSTTGQAFMATEEGPTSYLFCDVCSPIDRQEDGLPRYALPGSLDEIGATLGPAVEANVRAALRREGIGEA